MSNEYHIIFSREIKRVEGKLVTLLTNLNSPNKDKLIDTFNKLIQFNSERLMHHYIKSFIVKEINNTKDVHDGYILHTVVVLIKLVISISDYKYYTKDETTYSNYSSNLIKNIKDDYEKYNNEYEVCEAGILSINKNFFKKDEVS